MCYDSMVPDNWWRNLLAMRDEEGLWDALKDFLRAIIPVAEEEDVWMGLHPDDLSFNVRARPRIVKDGAALRGVVETVPSSSNSITFCPGSLATNRGNFMLAIAEDLWPYFVFCHFRNIFFLWDED